MLDKSIVEIPQAPTLIFADFEHADTINGWTSGRRSAGSRFSLGVAPDVRGCRAQSDLHGIRPTGRQNKRSTRLSPPPIPRSC